MLARAEPRKTGVNLRAIVARRTAAASSGPVMSRSSSQASAIASSTSASVSISSARLAVAASRNSAGISPEVTSSL